MKKYISLALAALMAVSALASCAPARPRLDDAISLASSDAQECAAWLDERLDAFPTDVIVGIGSNETYGIDMTDFEADGYILRSIGNDTLVFGASADGLDRAVRAYAKAADAGSASTLDEAYHEGPRIKKLTIAGRDIAEFTVVYNFDREVKNPGSSNPTFGNAKYAAEELVRLVEQATGITLIAVPHTEKVSGAVISIDYYTGDDLGENGFTYEVKDGNIYINGVGRANGCANAVYYLLEHECGWDALLFGDSDLQPSDHVDIPNGTSKKVKPMFDYFYMRHMFYDDFDTDKSTFSHFYIGSVTQASHSIHLWTGTGGDWKQPCLTERGIVGATADNIWSYLNAQENAGKVVGEDVVYIDLGMTDNSNFCSCADCRDVYIEENRTYSGAIIRFVNAVNAELEGDYPDLKYSVFAYLGTNVPCKTKPHENIYITFCTNGACANHPFDGSQCGDEGCINSISNIVLSDILNGLDGKNPEYDYITNTDFANWIEGWDELTDNIYIYHYILPDNFNAYTYLRNLYEDMHFFYNAGVKGFAPEAEYTGLGVGRLRFQLIMDIIWHPEMTKDEYELRIAEHMRREYGDGFDKVEEYIGLWEQTEVNTGCWDCWVLWDLITTDRYDTAMYASLAPRMYELLSEAMKGCSNAKQESRIKRLMCDVLYKECSIKYFPAYDADDTKTLEYLDGLYDTFVSYMKEHGYNFGTPPTYIWSFGPYAYNGFGKSMQDNLTDAAWIDWIEYRDDLTPEGTTQRPMPDGYETDVPEE